MQCCPSVPCICFGKSHLVIPLTTIHGSIKLSDIEKNCDILVIGGGGSGLVAACRAATLGKKVIVLEKTKMLGGGMNNACTMRTFGSRWQKERNLPDTTMLYLRNRMDETFWRIDRQLANNVVLGTGRFFDWFCDIAPNDVIDQFEVGRYVFDSEIDGPLGPQREGGPGLRGSGRLIVEVTSLRIEELDGEIITEAATESIQVEDGRVTGAVVKHGGDTLNIRCKACILASGSWIRNYEFVKRHYPKLYDALKFMRENPHTNRAYTGDGLALAEKAGALMDETNLTIRMMGPRCMCRSRVLKGMGNSPYSIYVNSEGKRFVCEVSLLRMGVFESGAVQLEQPDGKAFVIFDDAGIKHSIADGKNQPKPQVPMPAMMASEFPSSVDEAYDEINKAVDAHDGVIFKADTIQELAEMLELPADSLADTISRYNICCKDGKDWDCYKPESYLQPIQAPFYAVKAEMTTDGAFGGVEIDSLMHAKAANGGVVEGLYVVGDLASGRFINMAGIKKQIINDMSFALSSGFIAGTDAAENI